MIKGLVENHVPIEYLKLIPGTINNKSIEAISQMKQIKILHFDYCKDLTGDKIIQLAEELPQL